MENTYQSLGFKDEEELLVLVAKINLDTKEKLTKFTDWKEKDGSKEGLLKLLNKI